MSSTPNDTTKNGVATAKEQAGEEHTFMSAISMFVKGVGAVTSVLSILRSLDRDDGLAWFGLAHKQPLRSLGLFGAGVTLGAGVGVLFAPMSGADLRRQILGGEKDLERSPS